jgi:hypothetical protein
MPNSPLVVCPQNNRRNLSNRFAGGVGSSFGVLDWPWALTLQFNSQEIGTSRWQLWEENTLLRRVYGRG